MPWYCVWQESDGDGADNVEVEVSTVEEGCIGAGVEVSPLVIEPTTLGEALAADAVTDLVDASLLAIESTTLGEALATDGIPGPIPGIPDAVVVAVGDAVVTVGE